MTLAVMQPYIFPYIGYYQLINSVDKFIFYDDVNFIKNGWINRNRIIANGQVHYITIQLKDASSFKLIKDVEFTDNRKKILKTIEQSYKRAPFFKSTYPLISKILGLETTLISEQAIYSITEVCNHIGIKTRFEVSSETYFSSKGLDKADRLISICKSNNCTNYINPIGGIDIYSKDYFNSANIKLDFIQSKNLIYNQSSGNFVPNLSIIDILMHNNIEETRDFLYNFELI